MERSGLTPNQPASIPLRPFKGLQLPPGDQMHRGIAPYAGGALDFFDMTLRPQNG